MERQISMYQMHTHTHKHSCTHPYTHINNKRHNVVEKTGINDTEQQGLHLRLLYRLADTKEKYTEFKVACN